MQQASLLTTDYLDILYTNRNKAYGSYELRKHYNQRAGKALAAMLVLCVLVVGYIALPQKKQQVIASAGVERTIDLIDYKPQPMPELTRLEPIEASQPDAAIADFAKPRIVTDQEIQHTELSQVADLEGRILGTENVVGTSTNSDAGTAADKAGTGGGTTSITPPAPEPILTYVPEMPSFNGNLMEYLSKNLRYPEAARDANIEGRVVVQFIIDESGGISQAKVLKGIGGGCDEEALRVINKMPRWKAGKQNDKAVKVLLTLPIVFQLQ